MVMARHWHLTPNYRVKVQGKKASEIVQDISHGDNPIITKQERKRKEIEQHSATFEVLAREWLDTKKESWVTPHHDPKK